MGKKYKPFEVAPAIEEALDKGFARLVINTQSKLSAGSPVDTGRLASSWMVGKDQPDTSVAPEMEEGSTPTIQEYEAPITFGSDFYVSNSLEYAARAAYDPGYVGRRGGGAGDWFTMVTNALPKDATRSFGYFLKKLG